MQNADTDHLSHRRQVGGKTHCSPIHPNRGLQKITMGNLGQGKMILGLYPELQLFLRDNGCVSVDPRLLFHSGIHSFAKVLVHLILPLLPTAFSGPSTKFVFSCLLPTPTGPTHAHDLKWNLLSCKRNNRWKKKQCASTTASMHIARSVLSLNTYPQTLMASLLPFLPQSSFRSSCTDMGLAKGACPPWDAPNSKSLCAPLSVLIPGQSCTRKQDLTERTL